MNVFFQAVVTSILLTTSNVALAQITSISHPLNMEITNDLDCKTVTNMKNSYTPADLLPAIRDCISKRRYDDAVRLYLFQHMYLVFDKKLMLDASAQAGMGFVQYENFVNITENQRRKLQISFKKSSQKESDFVRNICSKIKELGAPNYKPIYMLAHGLKAIYFENENVKYRSRSELLSNLRRSNRSSTWNETLKSTNLCL